MIVGGWVDARELARSDDAAFDRLNPDPGIVKGWRALAAALIDETGRATATRLVGHVGQGRRPQNRPLGRCTAAGRPRAGPPLDAGPATATVA